MPQMRERHGGRSSTSSHHLHYHHHHTNHSNHSISSNNMIVMEEVVVDDADIAAGLLQQQQQQPLPTKNPLLSPPPPPLPLPPQSDASSISFAAEPISRTTTTATSWKHSNRTGSSSSNNNIHIMAAPSSMQSLASLNTRPEHYPSDLEFFEDLVSEPVLLLGVDISHLDRQSQFLVCAAGVFGFSLLYGYLQELISVQLCHRQLGLFLAVSQFSGYTLLAYILRNFVYAKSLRKKAEKIMSCSSSSSSHHSNNNNNHNNPVVVPLALYVGLSLLRAIDLGMTNLAMQYINYPAKTLMKSSRVVFTMLFGVVIARKVYKTVDYVIVLAMVAGLALFMHADANSSAVFDWAGVAMLTISLLCDGAISNMSETIMNRYGVGQDEFIFRMYSIALVAITVVAAVKGDLREGIIFMMQPGSYGPEMSLPVEERTWSVPAKVGVMVLFSSMGFFGSSCSAAITKNFGALTMSITSTARKATTLFLSFFLFNNVCTIEHLLGVFIFISALTAKSLRRGRKEKGRRSPKPRVFEQRLPLRAAPPLSDLETRALYHGSGSRDEMTGLPLEDMEAGHTPSGSPQRQLRAPVPPPSSNSSHHSDAALHKSRQRTGSRQRHQRKSPSASASPTIQVL